MIFRLFNLCTICLTGTRLIRCERNNFLNSLKFRRLLLLSFHYDSYNSHHYKNFQSLGASISQACIYLCHSLTHAIQIPWTCFRQLIQARDSIRFTQTDPRTQPWFDRTRIRVCAVQPIGWASFSTTVFAHWPVWLCARTPHFPSLWGFSLSLDRCVRLRTYNS